MSTDRLSEEELAEIRARAEEDPFFYRISDHHITIRDRRKLLTEVTALKAELAAAIVDAEKWRAQERLQERRDDAAERGGDW